jgi:hypothetical protein
VCALQTISGRFNFVPSAIFNGVSWMTDIEDLKLKAEIDDIMKSVENIMQKVEKAIPANQEESQAPSE